ncbi:MAG: matrixin family metalloprotease [Candidatus Didemnitutus sp.]|nr:matrixin family metalloprotease [Candidatus Didemnitutus sp.]
MFLVLPLHAYDLIRGPEGARVTWDDGTVPLVIRMPGTPTLQDGSNYVTSMQAAVQAWNAQMARVEFGMQIEPAGLAGSANGINEVAFDSAIYSNDPSPMAFGPHTLAVTVSYRSANPRADGTYARVQADVIFNTAFQWSSYRGALQTSQDIRRVAMHELGHVLGLNHPDQAAQSVAALMNSTVSNTDTVQPDDLVGAQYLYGRPGGIAAPPNDNFSNATVVSLSSGTTSQTGSTIGATHESGEPMHAAEGGASAWWRWTAPGDGVVSISTAGSAFDTLLAVYSGSSVSALTHVISSDDAPGLRTSAVAFTAVGGRSYYFAVDGWKGEWGVVQLQLNFAPAPPSQAPVILVEPTDQMLVVGSGARFDVQASGAPVPGLQWQRQAAGTSSWSDLGDSATYQEVNSVSLRVLNVSLSMNGDRFRCVATNTGGAAISRAAVLSIQGAPPLIVEHPLTQGCPLGESVTLSVGVAGQGPFSYQWQRNWIDLPGENGPTLKVTAPPYYVSSSLGFYQVVVSNANSSTRSLGADIVLVRPPAFLSQPRGGIVPVGTQMALLFAAVMDYGSKVQWYHNGTLMPGKNDAAVVVQAAQASDAGEYRAVITNLAGVATSTAAVVEISPLPPPWEKNSIGLEHSSDGRSLTLRGGKSGSWGPSPRFQWYKDGLPIPGATTLEYFKAGVSPADYGSYYYTITNEGGVGLSRTINIYDQAIASEQYAWDAVMESGEVAYFFYKAAGRLDRYHLGEKRWLTSLPLPAGPTSVAVAPDAIYFATSSALSRASLEGTGTVQLATVSGVQALMVRGSQLLVVSRPASATVYRTLDRMTGELLGEKVGTIIADTGLSYSAQLGKLFLRDWYSVGTYLFSLEWFADGTFGELRQAERSFGAARQTWTVQEGHKVIEASGATYFGDALSFAGALGRPLDAIVESGSQLWLLSGGLVSRHGSDNHLQASARFPRTARWMALRGTTLIGFSFGVAPGATPVVDELPLSEFVPPATPASPVSPEGLPIPSPLIETNSEGTVIFIYSKFHQSVFRWSVLEGRWLSSIPVAGWPDEMIWSPAHSSFYYETPLRELRRIHSATGSALETPVTNGFTPYHAAGDFLVGRRNSAQLATLDAGGALMDLWTDLYRIPHQAEWDGRGGNLISVVGTGANPDQLISLRLDELGRLQGTTVGPSVFSNGALPVRLESGGERVLIGSGHVLDRDHFGLLGVLPVPIVDGIWLGGVLHTIERTVQGARVSQWADFSKRSVVHDIPEEPVALRVVRRDLLVAITQVGGVLQFRILSPDDYSELTPSILNRRPVASLQIAPKSSVGATLPLSVDLDDPDGNFAFGHLRVKTPDGATYAVLPDGSRVSTDGISVADAFAFSTGRHPGLFKFDAGSGSYEFSTVAVDTLQLSSLPSTVVVEVAVPLTPLEAWKSAVFSSAEREDPSVSALAADPDSDALSNLMEYALGSNPRQASAHLAWVDLAFEEIVYTYQRPVDRADIVYAVEVSADLEEWTEEGVAHEWVATEGDRATWRARHPRSSGPLFFRLKVTVP